jgi:hypothetical protein
VEGDQEVEPLLSPGCFTAAGVIQPKIGEVEAAPGTAQHHLLHTGLQSLVFIFSTPSRGRYTSIFNPLSYFPTIFAFIFTYLIPCSFFLFISHFSSLSHFF